MSYGEEEKGKEKSSRKIMSGVCVLNTRRAYRDRRSAEGGGGAGAWKEEKREESWDAGPLLFIALLTGLESPRISLNSLFLFFSASSASTIIDPTHGIPVQRIPYLLYIWTIIPLKYDPIMLQLQRITLERI